MEATTGALLAIFPLPIEDRQEVTVRVWIGAVARSSPSPPRPSRATLRRPPQGGRNAAVRARGCPAPSSLLVLQDARRGARPRPQDMAAARPPRYLCLSTSLPGPGPRPRQPWARDQPYEWLYVTPTPCLRAGLPPIAHRALRVLTVMLVLVAICVSCHARNTHQLNDRGEREDAEQNKKTRGGKRARSESSGGSGWSPTRSSLRSGHAQLTHQMWSSTFDA